MSRTRNTNPAEAFSDLEATFADGTPDQSFRGRGRPPKVHDNSRVKDFLSDYPEVADLLTANPGLADVFAGIGAARSEGDTAKRPLPASRLFGLLARCDIITTGAVAEALAWAKLSAATIKRYTLAARTLSQFIGWEIDRAARAQASAI